MYKTQETRPKTLKSLGQEDALKKKMATHSSVLFLFSHSSILAWRIPWREEPCRLQSMEWRRVGHDCSNLAHKAQGTKAFLGGSDIKNLPAVQEIPGFDPWIGKISWRREWLPTHNSILAQTISWTEEPGGLQSMWLQRMGHDWAINTRLIFKLL